MKKGRAGIPDDYHDTVTHICYSREVSAACFHVRFRSRDLALEGNEWEVETVNTSFIC